jgi:hypothetical protein
MEIRWFVARDPVRARECPARGNLPAGRKGDPSEVMIEEYARRSAERVAFAMGITFYVVRNPEGDFLAVQNPTHDCEIIATVTPPDSVQPDNEDLS